MCGLTEGGVPSLEQPLRAKRNCLLLEEDTIFYFLQLNNNRRKKKEKRKEKGGGERKKKQKKPHLFLNTPHSVIFGKRDPWLFL